VKITPSRRADYALQAMIYLASADKARTAAPEIAEQAMTDQLTLGSPTSLAADDRALLEGRFKKADDVRHRRARDGRP
jgi:hypothetical protein